MDAGYTAANEVYAEIRPRMPTSRRSGENVKAFRNETYLWFSVAEFSYDNFMIRNRNKG